jgi:rubrerythrin
MRLNTASQVISLARKIEEDGTHLYETMAQRFAANREMLLSFAKENKKSIAQVEMAYYGVITDAIEGCFAFDIDPDEYTMEARLAEGAAWAHALRLAIEMEERTLRFYTVAAEQSKSLLADVPRVFSISAKKRGERLQRLRAAPRLMPGRMTI